MSAGKLLTSKRMKPTSLVPIQNTISRSLSAPVLHNLHHIQNNNTNVANTQPYGSFSPTRRGAPPPACRRLIRRVTSIPNYRELPPLNDEPQTPFPLELFHLPPMLEGFGPVAPFWEGPLRPFTCYLTECDLDRLQRVVKHVLEMMKNDGCVDYAFSEEEFRMFGRMYGQNNMAEFNVAFFRMPLESDVEQSYVMEITRRSGDPFVHESFTVHVIERLKQNQVILITYPSTSLCGISDVSEPSLSQDFDLNLELDLPDMDIDMKLEMPEECEVSRISESCIDGFLQVVTSRESYQEETRDCIVQLLECMRKDAKVLTYVASHRNIIPMLLHPVCQDFFDTFIIHRVLCVVHELLSRGEGMDVGRDVMQCLWRLARRWNSPVQNRIGSFQITFCPSQQVVRMAQKCLASLPTRV